MPYKSRLLATQEMADNIYKVLVFRYGTVPESLCVCHVVGVNDKERVFFADESLDVVFQSFLQSSLCQLNQYVVL